MIFFPSNQLIENNNQLNKVIVSNKKNLDDKNIFIFGIKPNLPSSQYGYILSKKVTKGFNTVLKFIEKPNSKKAKKIIKKNAYWNSGILFANKISIINNFNEYQPDMLKLCIDSVYRSKLLKNVYLLNKKSFKKIKDKSFDYAILEKVKNINCIKLNIPWSDLGSWSEILKTFTKNKNKYFKRRNIFYRPWGKYINLFSGKGFLIKELTIKPKSSISLQKHKHRSEYWNVISGKAFITINKKKSLKKVNETAFVPKGAIHRIENYFDKSVKIMEAQTGNILKETDIIRYKDVYGRVK